jgi:hypothetical protein
VSPSFWCASVLGSDDRALFLHPYDFPSDIELLLLFVWLALFLYGSFAIAAVFAGFLLLDPMRSRFYSTSFIYFLQSWCDLSVSLWFFRCRRFPRDLPPGSDENVLFSVLIFLSIFRSCGTEFGFPLYSSLI